MTSISHHSLYLFMSHFLLLAPSVSLSLSVCPSLCLFIYHSLPSHSITFSFASGVFWCCLCPFPSFLSLCFTLHISFSLFVFMSLFLSVCCALSPSLSLSIMLSHSVSPSFFSMLFVFFALSLSIPVLSLPPHFCLCLVYWTSLCVCISLKHLDGGGVK